MRRHLSQRPLLFIGPGTNLLNFPQPLGCLPRAPTALFLGRCCPQARTSTTFPGNALPITPCDLADSVPMIFQLKNQQDSCITTPNAPACAPKWVGDWRSAHQDNARTRRVRPPAGCVLPRRPCRCRRHVLQSGHATSPQTGPPGRGQNQNTAQPAGCPCHAAR
jgi:hypothetical protein